MRRISATLLLVCTLSLLVLGCDQVTAHKIASTIFDGVPSLPPAEQYCQDYHEQQLLEEQAAVLAANNTPAAYTGSKHAPYAEKRCNDCHDKSKESGLIRPPNKLCFLCHPGIIDSPNVHGPAAVGGCLECHEAHSSANPSLLKLERAKLCFYCHTEKRLAESMHQRFTDKGMLCMECHDPHAGNHSYFLK